MQYYSLKLAARIGNVGHKLNIKPLDVHLSYYLKIYSCPSESHTCYVFSNIATFYVQLSRKRNDHTVFRVN